MPESLLNLRDVSKRFGATVALDGVDFEIQAGDVHALIGENGAGKSTLLNILSGLLRPDAGTMELDGRRYAPRGPAEGRRAGIAHIHQELALAPQLSVAENILLGIEPAAFGWLRRRELEERAARFLGELGRGEIDPAARLSRLSLPDRQVVEVCRALAFDARILLMDEPTSSLQRADVERLFGLIRRLAERGVAIVYISHFLEEVREVADRFTVLRDGRSVGTGEISAVGDPELIALMVGREVAAPASPSSRPSPEGARPAAALVSDVALEIDGVELRRGEILGLAGLIGSGRTELLRRLFRAHPEAGYLPEDRKSEGLALQLPIADNVTMSRPAKCSRWGWIDRRRQAEQTDELLGRLRVKAPGPYGIVQRLSGGNQQKVALARLLHQDADVLLLDEPARGIDVGAKADIFREIVELAAAGKAILLVSSYLPELFAVCDRIAVMHRGRLSEARPTDRWTPDSILEIAVGGEGGGGAA